MTRCPRCYRRLRLSPEVHAITECRLDEPPTLREARAKREVVEAPDYGVPHIFDGPRSGHNNDICGCCGAPRRHNVHNARWWATRRQVRLVSPEAWRASR